LKHIDKMFTVVLKSIHYPTPQTHQNPSGPNEQQFVLIHCTQV